MAWGGMKTGSGVAETFAHVFAPAPRSARKVLGPKIPLANFSRPAQFPSGARAQLRLKYTFPRTPRAISQPDPDEMKDLMDEDARELRRIVEQRRIQNNAAPAEISRGMHRFAARLARKQASPHRREG